MEVRSTFFCRHDAGSHSTSGSKVTKFIRYLTTVLLNVAGGAVVGPELQTIHRFSQLWRSQLPRRSGAQQTAYLHVYLYIEALHTQLV